MVYVNCKIKVIITCPYHGDFNQTPDSHIQGTGCPECGKLVLLNKATKETTKNFIEKAIVKHAYTYIYDEVIYLSCDKKVKIICPEINHGLFEQTPYNHLQGQGCPKCGIKKFSQKNFLNAATKFINQANKIHSNKYDYTLTIYTGVYNLIKIICPIHGLFEQDAHHHLCGTGCQKCSVNISKMEIKWLDSLGIDESFRHSKMIINGKSIKPDAYIPSTNTIYEFYGDYWHGNPLIYDANDINVSNKKKFGQLFLETIERENFLKNNGYVIVSIWESNFNNKDK